MSLTLFIVRKKKKLAKVRIPEDARVSELKTYISKSTDIAANQQTLTYDGVLLEDKNRLDVYRLPDNAAINLDIPLRYVGKFKVYVRIPSKKDPLKLRVGPATTVEELKRAIFYTQKITVEEQVLTYRSCVLENDRTLASVGIKAESMVELFLSNRSLKKCMTAEDSDSDVVLGNYRKGKL